MKRRLEIARGLMTRPWELKNAHRFSHNLLAGYVKVCPFPDPSFASLVQPTLWLAFFGIAMSNNFNRLTATLPEIPGVRTIGYLTFIGAGVIAMTTLFTGLFGGTILLFDKKLGTYARNTFKSTADDSYYDRNMAFGHDQIFIQAAVIMIFGLLLGVQFFEGYILTQIVYSLLEIMFFVGAFSMGFLFLSAAIAITMESPEGMQAVITLLTIPFFFTSNALLFH